MVKKRYFLGVHTRARVKERYGFELTKKLRKEFENYIHNQLAYKISQDGDREVYQFPYNGKTVTAVYDVKLHSLVTVLPRINKFASAV